jgi:uncharacterized protein involved in exopolysaccharide biosynthesis
MNATDQNDAPPVVVHENWADLIALEVPVLTRTIERPNYSRKIQQGLLFAAPILIAWLGLALIPPAFVSETSFILRHQAQSPTLPASGGDFSGTPSETGSADAYALRDFLLSRDAMVQSKATFAGSTLDARYGDFIHRVSVDYETSSGVITIHVKAAEPQQAQALAIGLRVAAEKLVAQFNQASASSEYLAPLAAPNLPDSPTRPDESLILLSAAALGLALAWSRRA